MISCRARLREFCLRKIRRFFQRVRSFFGSFCFFVKLFFVFATCLVYIEVSFTNDSTCYCLYGVFSAGGGDCGWRRVQGSGAARDRSGGGQAF